MSTETAPTRTRSADVVAALKRPRSRAGRSADVVFRIGLTAVAGTVLLVLGLMLYRTLDTAWPVFAEHGWELVSSTRWYPNDEAFGGAAFLFGTVVTSLIAIALAVPVSIGIALYLNEAAPPRVRLPLVYLVELLAAVPSVVYGLWGLFVFLPLLQDHVYPWFTKVFGWVPIFGGPSYGRSFATAGIILAIMIVPIVTAISREVTALVPRDHKEAALALGATRWEMMRLAILPYSRAGILGGVMLGFGRAIGETIAVALVIGGTVQITRSIFQPGYTIASVIASTFNEATGDQISALVALGVLLFAMAIIVNIAGRVFVWRAARNLR